MARWCTRAILPGKRAKPWLISKAMVEAAGGTIQDIVKVNTYLTDLRYREELARIRAEFFPDGKLPVSTLVGVAGLADPDMLVEIEAVAVLPEK